jgi:hypothetical protein
VAAACRPQRPGGARSPPTSASAHSLTTPRSASLLSPSALPPCLFTARSCRVPPPPPHALAGRARSDELRPPQTTPSRPELSLSLAQPVLTSISRGKPHSHVNCSPEFRPSSPWFAAPWKPHLRPFFSLTRASISFASSSRCSDTVSRAAPWPEKCSRR